MKVNTATIRAKTSTLLAAGKRPLSYLGLLFGKKAKHTRTNSQSPSAGGRSPYADHLADAQTAMGKKSYSFFGLRYGPRAAVTDVAITQGLGTNALAFGARVLVNGSWQEAPQDLFNRMAVRQIDHNVAQYEQTARARALAAPSAQSAGENGRQGLKQSLPRRASLDLPVPPLPGSSELKRANAIRRKSADAFTPAEVARLAQHQQELGASKAEMAHLLGQAVELGQRPSLGGREGSLYSASVGSISSSSVFDNASAISSPASSKISSAASNTAAPLTDKEFAAYVAYKSKLDSFGTHLDIRALNEHYGRPIVTVVESVQQGKANRPPIRTYWVDRSNRFGEGSLPIFITLKQDSLAEDANHYRPLHVASVEGDLAEVVAKHAGYADSDGACLFHSIAAQVGEDAASVRSHSVNWLKHKAMNKDEEFSSGLGPAIKAELVEAAARLAKQKKITE